MIKASGKYRIFRSGNALTNAGILISESLVAPGKFTVLVPDWDEIRETLLLGDDELTVRHGDKGVLRIVKGNIVDYVREIQEVAASAPPAGGGPVGGGGSGGAPPFQPGGGGPNNPTVAPPIFKWVFLAVVLFALLSVAIQIWLVIHSPGHLGEPENRLFENMGDAWKYCLGAIVGLLGGKAI